MNDSSLAQALDRWWFWLCFRASGFVGRLLNVAGLPGFVRDGQTYEFAGIKVRTTVGRWSTTISVNGVRVEFGRLTGSVARRAFRIATNSTSKRRLWCESAEPETALALKTLRQAYSEVIGRTLPP